MTDSASDSVSPTESPRDRGVLTPLHHAGRSVQQALQQSLQGLRRSVATIPAAWQSAIEGFRVSDERLAEELAAVRAELPTTEVWSIGKPQSGKSSIARGLTGASAEIVGQGFRPHTQHTTRYAYPSADLPLLIFTDTVGWGDIDRDAATIAEEIHTALREETQRARVFVLAVKVRDFATEGLRAIARQLRQQHPAIPCLLVLTCLHECYPSRHAIHPPYPPSEAEYPDLARAIAAQTQTFAETCDRVVPIDFTLEEDGYTPTFYGLAALRDALADLLPEAEARAIHQLLDGETGQRVGDLYRTVARRYIAAFAVAAAAIEAAPLPFASMPALTALQISMVGALGALYGQALSPSQIGGILSTIAGGFLAKAIGRQLLKFVPGVGTAIAATWAAAYTWALGEGACVYFGDLMGGKKPDPARIQAAMHAAFSEAVPHFRQGDDRPA